MKVKEHLTLYGVVMYAGEVGSGKTLSMTERAIRLKKKDKRIAVYSNYPLHGIKHFRFNRWDDLYNIPSYSVILCSESAVLASNRSWADFPQGVIEMLTQNRKWGSGGKRPPGVLFLCDAQSPEMVDKVFRQLTNQIVLCKSLCDFGNGFRLFFHRFFRPVEFFKTEGRRKFNGMYVFVATNKLRNSYDTFHQIKKPKEEKK